VFRGSRRFFKVFIALLALLAIAILTHSLWLPGVGYALIRDEGPAKADIAVVLAGDYSGNRIMKAAELVRAGYVPAALVSGPEGAYGKSEADLAVEFAAKRGVDPAWLIPFPDKVHSTQEEAKVLLPELRRRGVHSFLLVTSDFHSARAARIFRAEEKAEGGGPEMRVVTAADEHFHADSWWRNREAQKTVFLEWCKTVAAAVGM
jgi:uncharacterized SAM-binding protein YcdF (DUF218 family)